MYPKLFKRKSKLEECREMISILKAHDNLPSILGKEWYNPEALYRRDGKQQKDIIVRKGKRDIFNNVIKNNIEGPSHNVKPKGKGFKVNEVAASITYSAIPIDGTNFCWCRMMRDQLESGYNSKRWAENQIKFGSDKTMEELTSIPDENRKGLYQKLKLEQDPEEKKYIQNLINIAEKNGQWKKVIQPGEIISLNNDTTYTVQFEKEKKKLNKTQMIVDKKLNDLKVGDKIKGTYKYHRYGTIYWYFVGEFDENGLKKLPSKYYTSESDCCLSLNSQTLYDINTTHRVLDERLRTMILKNMDMGKYFKNVKTPKLNTPDVFRKKCNQYKKIVHEQCNKIMRTTVFCNAKTIENGKRLPKKDYDSSTIWSLPNEYFEKGKDGKPKYARLEDAKASIQKRLTDGGNIKLLENGKKQMQRWPTVDMNSVKKNTNDFKSCVLVLATHMVKIMKICKPYVLNDNTKTYMGTIECDTDTYNTLKDLYEYQVDHLLSDVMDWCEDTSYSCSSSTRPTLDTKFEPSGPRMGGGNNNDDDDTDDDYVPEEEEDTDDEEFDQLRQQINNIILNAVPEHGDPAVQDAQGMLDRMNNAGNGQDYEFDNGLTIIRNNVNMLLNGVTTVEQFHTSQIVSDSRVRAVMWLIASGQVNVENPMWSFINTDVYNDINFRWPFIEPPPVAQVMQEIPMYEAQPQALQMNEDDIRQQTWLTPAYHAMMGAAMTYWYRQYYFVVTNPINVAKDMYTLIPGTNWQLRLIVNLASTSSPLPKLITNTFTSWLVDKNLSNKPLSHLSDETFFGSIGMTEDGLMKNDGLTNIIQEKISSELTRMQNSAFLMGRESGFEMNEVQRQLKSYSGNFDARNEVQIQNFLDSDLMNNFFENLEKQRQLFVASLTSSTTGYRDSISISNDFKTSVTFNVQHAVLHITKAELQMWLDLQWLMYGMVGSAGIYYITNEYFPEQVRKIPNALYLSRILPSAAYSIYHIGTNVIGGLKAQYIPELIFKLKAGAITTSMVTYSHMLSQLWDDDVEDIDSVQRYLTNVDSWKDWLRSKIRFISLKYQDHFVQRRMGINAGEYIWFDTDNPDNNYNPNLRGLSKTQARYLHYPPGTCFQYGRKTLVVVDDLGDMYNSKACTEALLEQGYELQIPIDENDSTWDSIGQKVNELKIWLSKLPYFGSKLRVAYDFQHGDVHIVSVAAKNMSQSLKKTITLMHVLSLCDMNNVNTILLAAAAEEQQMMMPALVAMGFGVGSEMYYPTEELEIRKLFYDGFKVVGAMGLYLLQKALKSIPYTIPKAVVFEDVSKDILIPIDLNYQGPAGENGNAKQWTGIFWSPVKGVKHIFDGQNPNRTLLNFVDTVEEFVYTFMDEDGNLRLQFNFVNNQNVIQYIFKPSKLLYHVWFVREQ
jgi:hypothetical protein